MKPVYTIDTSGYRTGQKHDYKTVGQMIDAVIAEHFNGRSVALRYLSLQDHPGLALDQFMQSIDEIGTDKYDLNRKMSVAHDFYAEKGVELFAIPINVGPNLDVSAEALQDFYEGALQDRGKALEIDLIVIYDLSKLEAISVEYPDGVGNDAFKFRDPDDKVSAVLGFIKVM